MKNIIQHVLNLLESIDVSGCRPEIKTRLHTAVTHLRWLAANHEHIEACYNQDFVQKGAIVIIWTARPTRSEWRNGENALKDILISAGHICQNLYLACEAIGAGVSPLLTYDQDLLDAIIAVDGVEELAVYMATVGKTT